MLRVVFHYLSKLLLMVINLSGDYTCREYCLWTLSGESQLQGEVIALIDGQVILHDQTGGIRKYNLLQLPAEAQSEVLTTIGWGRIWTDDTGKYRFAGRLAGVEGEVVLLEDLSGAIKRVAIARLSQADRGYVLDAAKKPSCCADCVKARNVSGLAKIFGVGTGEVCEVVSGDTLRLQLGTGQQLVQLYGIAAPKLDQDAGPQSRDYLAKLVLGKSLGYRVVGYAPGAVAVCQIRVEGKSVDLSTMMVQAGLAWYDWRQTDEPNLHRAQIDAKSCGVRIWSQAAQVAPWEWLQLDDIQREDFRRELAAKSLEKAARKVAVAKPIERKAAKVDRPVRLTSNRTSLNRYFFQARQAWGRYWLNTESGARHNPSCRHYGNTRYGCYCGPGIGWACGHCGGLP
jgi:endonuclease YncB( thermonuclease family)